MRIALVGDENLSYPSHRELNAVRSQLGSDVETEWVATDGSQIADLGGFDGIWLVPGSPYADDDAALAAITWAREQDVPFLGSCAGLQYAVVEFFRSVIGDGSASHAEADGADDSNVVTALACSLVGECREVRPVRGTRFAELVQNRRFSGMHYCRYAPDAGRVAQLVAAGMTLQATADDAGAEVLELPANRFYLLSLFQPQIGALAGEPLHPLLREFVRCARQYALARPAAGSDSVAGSSVEG